MTLQPDWLGLVGDLQQAALVELLEAAPCRRVATARLMLLAPGLRPADEAEARARAKAVLTYLTEQGGTNGP